MSSNAPGVLTREEVLGGLPARRASTLLFAIESRTARLVARSRTAMARHLSERTAAEQERAFLDALAMGRDSPVRPQIQDLERYSPVWASLVPDDPGTRAALARMIGDTYPLQERQLQGMRRALGLDEGPVRQAFERLHHEPLASIYADRLPWRERVRWLRSRFAHRLETLPPFWTTFALTLTETVGAGILALPIALAEVGPIAGVVVLLVLGLINVVTMAAMAEAIARDGNVRYGHAYFGRLVGDYLGSAGAWILKSSFLAFGVVVLLAYYVGLSTTLSGATGVPNAVWTAVMFLVALFFLRRESLDATVASALVVGAASISLILLLSLITLPSITVDNLRHTTAPFVNGQPFQASLLELIFGVVLLAYFGHTSTANCAAVVLRRDPTAQSFIWGSVAATACAMALYGLWILAVNGAVPSARLAREHGTSLTPLAEEVGPIIYVVGSLFALLAMGMASIHYSLGLFNLTREWLPAGREADVAARGRFGRRGSHNGLLRGGRRFWIGMLPVASVFLLVEGLYIVGRESFTGPLSFVGTLTIPVLGGIFPMLMVVSSRRKGDCAVGMAWRLIGHPVVVGLTYAIFLATLLLHGLVLWEAWYQRLAAVLVSVAIVTVTLVALRRGAFRVRTVVELRVEPEGAEPTVVNIVYRGNWIPTNVQSARSSGDPEAWSAGNVAIDRGSHTVQIEAPTSPNGDLKVWTHRLTPEGESERLPATLAIRDGDIRKEFDLSASAGHVIVPVSNTSQSLEIALR